MSCPHPRPPDRRRRLSLNVAELPLPDWIDWGSYEIDGARYDYLR